MLILGPKISHFSQLSILNIFSKILNSHCDSLLNVCYLIQFQLNLIKRFRQRFKNIAFRSKNVLNLPHLMHNKNFSQKTGFFTFICLVNPKVLRTLKLYSNPEKKVLLKDGRTEGES